jgi:hypothetical protein
MRGEVPGADRVEGGLIRHDPMFPSSPSLGQNRQTGQRGVHQRLCEHRPDAKSAPYPDTFVAEKVLDCLQSIKDEPGDE